MGLFDAGSRGRDTATLVVHDRVATAANAISFIRLLGLPLFVWLMAGPAAYGQAFVVLVLVAATDWVDGYVARRFDQVTRLGQVMDPLLDRLLLATVGITLAWLGFMPWWLLALFVVRDAALLVVSFAVFRGPPPIPVSYTGKFATACLLIGVPGFLVGGMDWGGAGVVRAVAWLTSLVGVVAYYVAAVQYAQIAIDWRRPR